jgi:hypothetical protein
LVSYAIKQSAYGQNQILAVPSLVEFELNGGMNSRGHKILQLKGLKILLVAHREAPDVAGDGLGRHLPGRAGRDRGWPGVTEVGRGGAEVAGAQPGPGGVAPARVEADERSGEYQRPKEFVGATEKTKDEDRRQNTRRGRLCSSGRPVAEEHNDPPYVPRRSGLVDVHKPLCSSGTWFDRGI